MIENLIEEVKKKQKYCEEGRIEIDIEKGKIKQYGKAADFKRSK